MSFTIITKNSKQTVENKNKIVISSQTGGDCLINSDFDIKVVVSSAWKTMLDKDDFLKRLKRHQDIKRLTDIISDITPTSHCCSKNTRGFEIEMYINNNYNCHNLDNYVFLSIDDEKVETQHMSFVKHFRTNVSKGLMLYDIEKLKKILKEEKVG